MAGLSLFGMTCIPTKVMIFHGYLKVRYVNQQLETFKFGLEKCHELQITWEDHCSVFVSSAFWPQNQLFLEM